MANRELTLPALGRSLSDFARRSGIAGFWPWWTAQLNALVPPKPRAALERRRMRPVLLFDGDQATLWKSGMEGERAVMLLASTIPLAGDAATVTAAGRAAVAALTPGGIANTVPKTMVSVPPRDVLRKTLVLPAAIEPNLRQALSYDLDRHTPFKSDELYFDAVVTGRTPEKKEIRVELVSCRKAVVDSAVRHAATWGAAVAAVVPEPPSTAYRSRLNLLPHEARASGAVWKRWQFWLPLALVAVVALAAIAIPLWQKRGYAIALSTLAADARAQAAVSENLRAELDTKADDYNFALERKYAYPSAFRILDEMSRVLPDDTWLTQLEMKSIAKGKDTQREILVRGETANAGRLVQLVEESPLFAQTAPRSPTTKIQPGPGEIFDLGAQVKPLQAPAQVALLAVDKPAENAPAAKAAPTPPAAAAAAPTPAEAAPVVTGAPAAPAPLATNVPAAPVAAGPPAAPAPAATTIPATGAVPAAPAVHTAPPPGATPAAPAAPSTPPSSNAASNAATAPPGFGSSQPGAREPLWPKPQPARPATPMAPAPASSGGKP